MKKAIITIILLAVSVGYADVNFNIKMTDAKFLLLKEAVLYKYPQPSDPNEIRDLPENQWARKAFYQMVSEWVQSVLEGKDRKEVYQAMRDALVIREVTAIMEDQ